MRKVLVDIGLGQNSVHPNNCRHAQVQCYQGNDAMSLFWGSICCAHFAGGWRPRSVRWRRMKGMRFLSTPERREWSPSRMQATGLTRNRSRWTGRIALSQ